MGVTHSLSVQTLGRFSKISIMDFLENRILIMNSSLLMCCFRKLYFIVYWTGKYKIMITEKK